MNQRILVVTTEPVPLPGMAATGAGLRAWGLAFGLRSAGFENVTLAFAADAVRGRSVDLTAVPGVMTFERSRLDEFVRDQAPDALVFQHWGLLRELRETPRCPIAIDLAGPHLLERQLWDSSDRAADLREKLAALSRADHVVCSGRFQRLYFLPFLVQAGHDPRTNLCPVIPFSLSPDLPEPSPNRDHAVFLYGGMFLPWQDPEATLRTVVRVLEEKGRGRLLFIGGPHPGGDVSGGRFDRLVEMLDASPVVDRRPVMPFEDLLGVMANAGVAIDLMARNAEREVAFPTRTVTYLWAGLPVIHNNYDELADPIETSRAGWTFDPADQGSVEKLIVRLLGHREDVERRSRNAQDLVRRSYTWDRTIEPLAAWCARPDYRADKKAPVAPGADLQPARPAATVPHADRERPRRDRIAYAPPRPITDPGRTPWYMNSLVFIGAMVVGMALATLIGLAELARLVFRGRRTG